jgi:hypothetical protein
VVPANKPESFEASGPENLDEISRTTILTLMNTKGTAIAFLLIFSSLAPCNADPVRHRDISSDSLWAAHLDFTRLNDPPLNGFLHQVAGFDRILQLQRALTDQLAIDWESVGGVTLFGSGDRLDETAIILRGDSEKIDLTNLPIAENLPVYQGVSLRQGPVWQQTSLILAKPSNQELVAGSSLQAIKDSLNLLAGQKESRSEAVLPEDAANKINSAAAMLSLDMKRLNTELQFEADFTRAIQQAWFLIGSRDDLVEATIMIDSTDAEGLAFLQEQLQLLPALLSTQPNPPQVWFELAGAMEFETKGQWMTLKVAATPEKAAAFLKSLGPLFVNAPESSNQGD